MSEEKEAGAEGAGEDYRALYEREREAFRAYRTSREEEALRAAKESAYRELLRRAGVAAARIPAVLRVSDTETPPFEDGHYVDEAGLIGQVKREFADFLEVTETRGAPRVDPPGGGSALPEELTDEAYYRQVFRK